MTSFADLAPAIEIVKIRGATFELRGLPFKRCCELIGKFPEIVSAFDGKTDIATLLAHVPRAGALLVAHAMDRGEDEALIASFDENLVLGEQVELVNAVLKASLPNGRRPFVELLETFGVNLPGGEMTSETASPLPSPRSLNGTGSHTQTQ